MFALGLAACGPAEAPKTPVAPLRCGGAKMEVCGKDLARAAARGEAAGALLRDYMAARAAAFGRDPWEIAFTGMMDRRDAAAAIVDARSESLLHSPDEEAHRRGAQDALPAPIEGVRIVETAPLPAPSGLTPGELMLEMGLVSGYDHVIWLDGDPERTVHEVYPRDPLAPLLFGVPAVAHAGTGSAPASGAGLRRSLLLAATVRRAFDAAGAFRYVEAAKEAASLGSLIERDEPFEEPVLRARYARMVLTGAGLVLEAPQSLFGSDPADAKAAKIPPAPDPAAADTPYGDVLRVRLADDVAAEWNRRGSKVLPAIAEDRRAVATSTFVPPSTCNAVTAPPAYDRAGDVAFAGLLPGALAGARIEAIAGAQPDSGLPLTTWYPRYEALVDLVDRTHLAWLEMGLLVRQRGEIAGISPKGTATYKRVTELGLKHIAALHELADAEPERYPGRAELGLAYSGGLLADDRLRDALIDLTQATTKGKLARAASPEAIAGSLLIAVFTGMTYPPAIQSAHYLALQSAFAAKVKGDLSRTTGWGAAGLFALDAVFRLIADQGPNLAFSSDQIARALADPAIAVPNVAAVVAAAARYAALAKDKPLAALAKPAQFTPERGAAREALRKAIVDMGAPGEAPVELADDVTTLADGLIATASLVFHRKAPPPGTCADRPQTSTDIEIAHALQGLSVVRQKILQSPRFKDGDGLWTRRARLLVALLSDAMDLAAPLKQGASRKLSLSSAEIDLALTGALREWDEPGARDAIVGTYSLARFLFARDPKTGFEGAGPFLFRALGGIGRFLKGGDPASGTTLLDAIAAAPISPGGREDLLGALVSFSKAAYAKGQTDQGDVLLLATVLLTATGNASPPKEALELAAQHRSRIAWALAMFGEASAAEANGKPNVLAYAAGAKKAADEQCAVGRVDDMILVMGAVGQFAEGKRKEARAALRGVLDRADADGFVVPKISYQYAEKHEKKLFTLSFGLTYGLGFVEGGNTFQIGLGMSSIAERSAKLTVSAASPEETAPETARYYVRAAALAAAYDFLDGDAAQGAIDARRAASAIVSGVRLGARSITSDRGKWAEDARALLAVDAQLAADAGLPFLAGDLWTIVKDSLPPDTSDAKVDGVLAPAPLGLAGIKDAEASIERAKRSLRIVAAPLACTAAKVETTSFEQPTCAAYPLALALRIADVVKKLPRLKKAAENAEGSCASIQALDAFLDAADHGSYDPDAFTKAVESLRADGRADEAATLLARQRRDGHCSPALLATARALGRSQALLPASRADMLAVAVNCAGADGGADLEKDLLAIDKETRMLADPTRNLKLLFFVAQLALRADKPALLLPLVRGDGFIDRFLRLSGNAVAGALVLHHTAHLLSGEAFELSSTQGAFSLVCESFPDVERRAECDDLKALRDASTPAAARKTAAKAALERLLTPPAAPPAKRP